MVPGPAQDGPEDPEMETAAHMDAVIPEMALQERGPYVAIGLGTQLLLHDQRSELMHPILLTCRCAA